MKEEERFKRSIDSIKDVNGHTLDPKPDPETGWARCLECGRIANIKSDRFWARVSCNTNRTQQEKEGQENAGHL